MNGLAVRLAKLEHYMIWHHLASESDFSVAPAVSSKTASKEASCARKFSDGTWRNKLGDRTPKSKNNVDFKTGTLETAKQIYGLALVLPYDASLCWSFKVHRHIGPSPLRFCHSCFVCFEKCI